MNRKHNFVLQFDDNSLKIIKLAKKRFLVRGRFEAFLEVLILTYCSSLLERKDD